MTYAALGRYTPHALAGLVIVRTTPSYPGLPLITSNTTSASDIAILQAALREAVASAEAAPTLQALGIVKFETPDPAVYQRCVEMRRFAETLGYPTLA